MQTIVLESIVWEGSPAYKVLVIVVGLRKLYTSLAGLYNKGPISNNPYKCCQLKMFLSKS